MTHSSTCQTVKDVSNQLSATACGAARTAEEAVGQWTEKAQNNLETMTKAASSYAEQGQQKAQELGRAVTGKVKERPLATLLAAAGLGFLLGVMLRRR